VSTREWGITYLTIFEKSLLEDKMKTIRSGLIVLLLLLCLASSAVAALSISIGLPNVQIGLNLPVYPTLVPVPGYPVYYAPNVDTNYFFYDGMYWIYQNDNWYASSWYDGPWGYVEPEIVPLFILRIPVSYYRHRPASFRGWQSNAPPRWGQYWGRDWEQHRSGWDQWDRRSVPSRAPRPDYQRNYSGDRYPRGEQQQSLHNQNYRYQPRDQAVRQHYDSQQSRQRASAPAQRGKQDVTPQRSSKPQPAVQRPTSNRKVEPAVQRAQPQRQVQPQRQQAQPQRQVQPQRQQIQPQRQQVQPQRQQVQPQRQQVQPQAQPQRQQPQDQKVRAPENGKAQGSRNDNGKEQEKNEGKGRDRNN
jgi:hypothetical protein